MKSKLNITLFNGLVEGKFYRKDPYLNGTFGLVSGVQIFPNQSIDFPLVSREENDRHFWLVRYSTLTDSLVVKI
jgi:hypothetical protein